MDFLIVYERKLRELENALLLKIEIERRGYSCEVVQFYEADKYLEIKQDAPKVILAPHMYETKSILRLFTRFGRANYLINLQYEQVLSKEWEEIGHHNPKGEAINAVHVCWGLKTKERLIQAGIPSDNIRVLGSLQFDLLREELKVDNNDIKSQMSETYHLPKDTEWTLFLSSFTFADIAKARLEMNESVAKTDLSQFVEIYTSSRNKILSWFREILEKDKKNLIIYRPHPDELSLNKVYALEKEYPNFKVIREGSAKIWIESCDNIYSWISTSVIEAHFLRKMYSILRPITLPESFDSVVMKNAKFITNYEGFEQKYFSKEENIELPIEDIIIQQYYDFSSECPSFYRYADMLENLIESNRPQKYNIPMKLLIKSKIIAMGVKLVHSLYKTLDINLNEYRSRTKNNFFVRWFIEFDDQIASKEEKQIIEQRIMNIFNHEDN